MVSCSSPCCKLVRHEAARWQGRSEGVLACVCEGISTRQNQQLREYGWVQDGRGRNSRSFYTALVRCSGELSQVTR